MIENRTPAQKSLTVVNYAIITLAALICLYPMLHVLSASFSDPIRLIRHRKTRLIRHLRQPCRPCSPRVAKLGAETRRAIAGLPRHRLSRRCL